MIFKNKTKMTDKLWITAERDGKIIYSAGPKCEMSLLSRILAFLGLKKCTGDLIPTVGLSHMAQSLIDDYGYAAYGTSATAPTMADTTLGAEIDRIPIDSAELITTTYTNDTARWSAQFTIASDVVIEEFGLFTAAVNGDMHCHQLTDTISLTANDKITFIAQTQVS